MSNKIYSSKTISNILVKFSTESNYDFSIHSTGVVSKSFEIIRKGLISTIYREGSVIYQENKLSARDNADNMELADAIALYLNHELKTGITLPAADVNKSKVTLIKKNFEQLDFVYLRD